MDWVKNAKNILNARIELYSNETSKNQNSATIMFTEASASVMRLVMLDKWHPVISSVKLKNNPPRHTTSKKQPIKHYVKALGCHLNKLCAQKLTWTNLVVGHINSLGRSPWVVASSLAKKTRMVFIMNLPTLKKSKILNFCYGFHTRKPLKCTLAIHRANFLLKKRIKSRDSVRKIWELNSRRRPTFVSDRHA